MSNPPIYEINTKLPLIKLNELSTNYITPKISFRINPSDMKNHSADNRLLTTDTIFDINRLGITDSYEAGKSITFGVDFKKEKKAAGNFKIKEVAMPTHYGDEISHLKSIPYGLNIVRTTLLSKFKKLSNL